MLLLAFALAVLVIALTQPVSLFIGAANLVPFGLALIAARANSRRGAAWGALAFNALWALLYFAVVIAAALRLAGLPRVAVFAAVIVGLPCALNMAFFWRQLREPAPPSHAVETDG
jgi:hypothetical protein